MYPIPRIGGAQGQAHAVQRQRIACADAHQGLDVCTAVGEIVLAVRLEPTDPRCARQHLQMMLRAQADAGGCRHRFAMHDGLGAFVHIRIARGCAYLAIIKLPPARRSQVPFGTMMNSLPLASVLDWPGQAWAGPAQSFLPALTTP